MRGKDQNNQEMGQYHWIQGQYIKVNCISLYYNKQFESEISKNSNIISNTKKHCLGIKITKDVQDFSTENYKILPREIKEGRKKRGVMYHIHRLKEYYKAVNSLQFYL